MAVSLIVAVFYALAVELLLDFVLRSDILVLAAAPAVSIMATHALLAVGGRGLSSSTTNVYVRAFHERHPRIPIGELPLKLLAGLATIGRRRSCGAGGSVDLHGLDPGIVRPQEAVEILQTGRGSHTPDGWSSRGCVRRVQDSGHRA